MSIPFRYLLRLTILLSCTGPTESVEPPDSDKIQGIVISTHGGGRDWGYDTIVSTLEDIRSIGANWVATHPYGTIQADGSIRFRNFNQNDPPSQLVRPIREAHSQGMRIWIKPHLAYWRSPFEWRGEITFESREEWDRFWTDYRDWILSVVSACRDADGIVIGTELDKTLHHEKEWRNLIAEVREITEAKLTYASNWTDYQRVPFWDALDLIGIQAYFPLTSNGSPSATDIRNGWDKQMAELRKFADRHDRDILFAELGYNQSFLAAAEPWNYRVDGEAASSIQEACWHAALQAIESEPRIAGAMLWKWFPNPRPAGRNFRLATPRIKNIISNYWLEKPIETQ